MVPPARRLGVAPPAAPAHDWPMNLLARRVAALLTAGLLCLAAATAVEAAAPRGTYAGKVSGTGLNQKLRFSVAGNTVGRTRARVSVTCNGPYTTITYRLRGSVRIKRNRTFRLVKRQTVRTRSSGTFTMRVTVAGKFNRAGTRAVGTVGARGTVTEPGTMLRGGLAEPGETASCATPPGKQRFRVKRARR